jgi:uncharacterized protein YbaP (TraB family)
VQGKRFAWLSPLFLLLSLLAAVAARAETEKGLLWRIETREGAVSHLFGTIHSEDPRVLALPEPVSRRFDSARTLVLEMDLGAEDAVAMGQAMMLPAGEALRELLGPELYRQGVAAMAARGFPEAVVNRLQPWALILTLSMPQPETGLFLDYLLYLKAAELGKAVVGLERMDEQLAVFNSLSVNEQVSLLRDTLRDHDDFPRLFEQLLTTYLERDLQKLLALSEQQNLRGSDSALQQRFMSSLVDERNRRMASRLLPLLEKGGVFAAVGALHLPGETGLVAQLRRQGLELTPIY